MLGTRRSFYYRNYKVHRQKNTGTHSHKVNQIQQSTVGTGTHVFHISFLETSRLSKQLLQRSRKLKQFNFVEHYYGQDVFFPPQLGSCVQVNDNTEDSSLLPLLSGCQGLNSGSQVSISLLPTGIYKNWGGEEMVQ